MEIILPFHPSDSSTKRYTALRRHMFVSEALSRCGKHISAYRMKRHVRLNAMPDTRNSTGLGRPETPGTLVKEMLDEPGLLMLSGTARIGLS